MSRKLYAVDLLFKNEKKRYAQQEDKEEKSDKEIEKAERVVKEEGGFDMIYRQCHEVGFQERGIYFHHSNTASHVMISGPVQGSPFIFIAQVPRKQPVVGRPSLTLNPTLSSVCTRVAALHIERLEFGDEFALLLRYASWKKTVSPRHSSLPRRTIITRGH